MDFVVFVRARLYPNRLPPLSDDVVFGLKRMGLLVSTTVKLRAQDLAKKQRTANGGHTKFMAAVF